MRKFALAALALVLSFGIVIAGEVVFVKYNEDKKELTVKDGDKEVTLKITDKTTFKRGDKDFPADKALPFLAKGKEGKTKFEVTSDKGEATEIKFKGKGK